MIIAGMTSFHLQHEMLINRQARFPNAAVVPAGSIEQHGPNLPLSTDTFLVEALAREIDRLEAGRLFIYLAFQYTNSESGMGLSQYAERFPGFVMTTGNYKARAVLTKYPSHLADSVIDRGC